MIFAIVAFLAAATAGGRPPEHTTGLAAATDSVVPVLTWLPARPRQGTLARLVVTPIDPKVRLRGEAAGEPLHFEATGSDSAIALVPVPIDSSGTLLVTVIFEWNEGADTMGAALPITPGRYPTERLRVAPRFGERPDSALERRLADEATRARKVSREAHDTPRLWSLPFRPPRSSRITSTFGRGREFNGAISSRHMGTDFAGAVGAPVRAANRGVVRLVEEFYLGGNVVYLDHGAGLVTAYLHLSATKVAVGDTIERGQVIGAVGATGRVTGPHLHLIMRYGLVSVDPLSLIQKTVAQRPTTKGRGARRATSSPRPNDKPSRPSSLDA